MKIRALPKIDKTHFEAVAQIDRQRFGQEPSDIWASVAERFPNNYTILTLDDQVAGYGLIVPIDGFASEALKRGELGEDEIPQHIVDSRDSKSLYIASIASRLNAGPIIRSRLVGYSLGPVLRAPKEVIAVAVSDDGESIAREVGLTPEEYRGLFTGVNGYQPKLLVKPAFEVN